MQKLRGLIVAVALVGVAAACTGSDDGTDAPVVQLGGPSGTNRTLSSDEIDDLDAPPAHTPADVAFAQNMIRHHEQALVMTAMVDEGTDRRRLPLLAERMNISQTDEIDQLEEWLTTHGEEVPEGEHHHGGHDDAAMPGMLSDAELARLEAARGARFERLFLQFMIRHHEGALLMVAQLVQGGGGQEPAMSQLAQHIDMDQRVEIARMRSMLAEL